MWEYHGLCAQGGQEFGKIMDCAPRVAPAGRSRDWNHRALPLCSQSSSTRNASPSPPEHLAESKRRISRGFKSCREPKLGASEPSLSEANSLGCPRPPCPLLPSQIPIQGFPGLLESGINTGRAPRAQRDTRKCHPCHKSPAKKQKISSTEGLGVLTAGEVTHLCSLYAPKPSLTEPHSRGCPPVPSQIHTGF